MAPLSRGADLKYVGPALGEMHLVRFGCSQLLEEVRNGRPDELRIGHDLSEFVTTHKPVAISLNFTEESLAKLQDRSLSRRRQGVNAPNFSETVRVAIRLGMTLADQEIKRAFDDGLGGLGTMERSVRLSVGHDREHKKAGGIPPSALPRTGPR